jgi:hypothetical protein
MFSYWIFAVSDSTGTLGLTDTEATEAVTTLENSCAPDDCQVILRAHVSSKEVLTGAASTLGAMNAAVVSFIVAGALSILVAAVL